MEKYNLIQQQLLYEGTVEENYFFEPEDLGLETIAKLLFGIYNPEVVSMRICNPVLEIFLI